MNACKRRFQQALIHAFVCGCEWYVRLFQWADRRKPTPVFRCVYCNAPLSHDAPHTCPNVVLDTHTCRVSLDTTQCTACDQIRADAQRRSDIAAAAHVVAKTGQAFVAAENEDLQSPMFVEHLSRTRSEKRHAFRAAVEALNALERAR